VAVSLIDVATVGFAVVLGDVVGEVPGPSSAVAVAVALVPALVSVSLVLPASPPTSEGPQPAIATQSATAARHLVTG